MIAWWLNALGAFPVRRGQGDADMLDTARAILARGDAVLIFPEGTRIRPGALGAPAARRRPARAGDRRARRPRRHPSGPRRSARVADPPAQGAHPRRAPADLPARGRRVATLAAAVTDRIWPNVMLQWEWLGGLPPLRRAAVIGGRLVGDGRGGHARPRGLGGRSRVPHARAGRRIRRALQRALPERDRAARDGAASCAPPTSSSHATTSSSSPFPPPISPGGRRPRRRGPAAGRGAGVREGLVPPLGTLPAAYVAERVPAWAAAPSGARARRRRAARRRLARARRPPGAFARQLVRRAGRRGLRRRRDADIIGVELAGCAKNAAALAAAAAPARAPTPPGSPPAVFAEVDAYARRSGSRPETFAGSPARATSWPPCSPPARATAAPASCPAQGMPAGDIGPRSGRPPRPLTASRCSPRAARCRGRRARAGGPRRDDRRAASSRRAGPLAHRTRAQGRKAKAA